MSPTTPGFARPLAVLLAVAALAVPLSSSSIASADPTPAAVDEGRALFGKGVALFRAGDFRAALEQFTRAYAIAPSFRIQFNIGQTCAELQDHACATRAFEQFLADGGKQVPPAQRTTAERELRRLHALVGTVHVAVNVAGADVAIDDVPVGTSPLPAPITVNTGRRKISASKPPLAPVTSTIDVGAGQAADASLVLVDAAGTPLPPSVAEEPSRTPFWIGVTATGTLVVATVVLGVLTLGAKSDLDGAVGRFGATTNDIEHARSRVDSLALVTDVLGGAALVAGGITTYLYVSTRPASKAGSATQIGFSPGGITLKRAF